MELFFQKLEQNKTVENNTVKSINFVVQQRHRELKFNILYIMKLSKFILLFVRVKKKIHKIKLLLHTTNKH